MKAKIAWIKVDNETEEVFLEHEEPPNYLYMHYKITKIVYFEVDE